MKDVVSIKFYGSSRSYYFDPEGHNFKVGDNVIVETSNGMSLGIVTKPCHEVADEDIVSPLKKVIRYADKKDFQKIEENKIKEENAAALCKQKIAEHNLEMKLIRVSYSLDGSKITFFFTAEGRVDFRELVKDLASSLHARIELHQIGVRDEAKLLGGIGICGQPYCCKRFLEDFQPVSIKMAKEQGLSPNPLKLSGSCGRLMCCLQYEQSTYEYLSKTTPSVGTVVKTPHGTGTVTDVSLLTGELTVTPKEEGAMPFKINKSKVRPIHDRQKRQNNPDSAKQS